MVVGAGRPCGAVGAGRPRGTLTLAGIVVVASVKRSESAKLSVALEPVGLSSLCLVPRLSLRAAVLARGVSFSFSSPLLVF